MLTLSYTNPINCTARRQSLLPAGRRTSEHISTADCHGENRRRQDLANQIVHKISLVPSGMLREVRRNYHWNVAYGQDGG